MKNTIIGIVIGILVTVTVFHIWFLYQQNSRINSLETFAIQVTNIINSSKNK